MPDTAVSDAPPDVFIDLGDAATPGTCSDGRRNNTETDIDCGGPNCAPCRDGQLCFNSSHCTSGVCSTNCAGADAGCAFGICRAPTCADNVRNGSETDIDCGGSCVVVGTNTGKCLVGKRCVGGGDCATSSCAGTTCACPTGMVIMPSASTSGGDYCIDAQEVTYGQYTSFWVANPQLSSQPGVCSWNTTYTPSANWPPNPAVDPDAEGKPVNFVDWCDAYAFCKWSGKNLCQKVGGSSNAVADFADATKSQWFNACSAQGANLYPQGASSAGCNGGATAVWADHSASGVILHQECQGGAPGLYQMSGNVAEWEDSCTASTGATDNCRVRGGSFASSAAELQCNADLVVARSTKTANIGFRCCL